MHNGKTRTVLDAGYHFNHVTGGGGVSDQGT